MRRREKSPGRWRKLALLLAAAVLLCVGIKLVRDLGALISEMAQYRCNIAVTEALSHAVNNVMRQFDTSLLTVDRGADGAVTSLTTDVQSINLLQAQLMETLSKELVLLGEEELHIPIGTKIGGHWLNGRGPNVAFCFLPEGKLSLKLLSRFESSGVNQTKHQILLNVETQMLAITSIRSTSVSVPAQFLLAETVIVGEVPENYTNVVTEDSDLVNDLNDYRAGL